MRYLEDFDVGLSYRSPPYTVPKEEIVRFATEWDPQPFHLDEASPVAVMLGGLFACSAHVFALFSKLANSIDEKAAAIAALGFDELRMLEPVHAGDTVYLTTECTEVRRSKSKPDRGIVTSQARMFNQNDELVFSVRTTFLVQSRT